MREILWLDNESYRKQVIVDREGIKNEVGKRDLKKVVQINPDFDLDVSILVDIFTYTDPKYMDICLYRIYKDNKLIGEIYRNYSPYPQTFIRHRNGKLYFICGFDYQGYTIVNIDDEIINHYLPEGATKGCGWCPTEWRDYSSKTDTIIAEGCYWGGSFDRREYDFSNPDVLPLPLISESDLDPEPEEDDDDEEDSEL